jgi:hypothetical protein
MSSPVQLAALIAALWKLGAGSARMPTSHGVLDRALEACLADLPELLKTHLSFGLTAVGRRCYELPDILLAAQEALITSEPNPTYLATDVNLDESEARQIVLSNGITSKLGAEIGRRILDNVRLIEKQMASGSERTAAA